MRRLFEGGAYSSNYCNWQLKSLLHLGQIVITFRTLLHLGLLHMYNYYYSLVIFGRVTVKLKKIAPIFSIPFSMSIISILRNRRQETVLMPNVWS